MAPAAGRERILSEARDLFVESGLEGVTMRGVASRVGVTPMALYRHFRNRAELLSAIVDQGHATFLGYLNRALAEPTAAARLLGAGLQYLAFAVEHPRTYAVMFMEPVTQAVEGIPAWHDAATFRFLVDRVRESAEAGVLRTENAEETALTLWAHAHGLVSLYLAAKLPVGAAAFGAIYERSLRDLIRGLGRGEAPPNRGRPRDRNIR